MDGFIIERKESDGRVYRRGEMKLTEGEEVSKNDQVNDEVFLFAFFFLSYFRYEICVLEV